MTDHQRKEGGDSPADAANTAQQQGDADGPGNTAAAGDEISGGGKPMQADGRGTRKSEDEMELASRRGGAGESGGGAYPNPYRGKRGDPRGPGHFFGHGGQSGTLYEGPDNPNETTTDG